MKNPIPIIGSAKELISIFPISAISHTVTVLQTFDPKINQSDPTNDKIHAFTKPIAKSVVVEDDCKIAVAKNQEKNHFNFVFVDFSKNFTSIGPDADLIPSVMSDIPSIKIPIPQRRAQKFKLSIKKIVTLLFCHNFYFFAKNFIYFLWIFQ